jgi:hypothetical protein
MEIGKFKLAKANLIRPPKKPTSEFITREEAEAKFPGLFNAEVNENVVTKNYEAEEYINRIKSYMQSKYIDEDFGRQLVEKKLNEMEMAPSDLDTSRINRAIGGGAIEGEDLGTREGFGSPEAIEYLKSLKPGSAVNTYAVGKQFNVDASTVAGQVQRNFPELRLQTKKESAAKAAETRRELYKQKLSDFPVVETKIRGSGKEARGKGRDITGIRFPNEEMKNDYIQDLTNRYSGVRGRKGLTNKELAEKYLGSSNPNDIGRIERINNYFVKNLNLEYEKAPISEVKEKRTRRLAITQGGRSFKGTEDIPFHHIMPIGGEVDLTTKDVAFINKQMNSKLAPYNTKLNDIADGISNQLNNQEPGYLKRIDELNNQAEQIIESVKTRLPKKYQNYIGFNRLDPILDENATPIRLNVTRVGVDDTKSLAGKIGEPVKLEGLTQKNINEIKKLKYRNAIKNFPISTGGPTLGAVGDIGMARDILSRDIETGKRLISEYGPKVLQGARQVGKFAVIPELALGAAFAPLDLGEGRSGLETLLNVATLGMGVPISDARDRANYVDQFGLKEDLFSAQIKQSGAQYGAPELTEREQLALQKAEEFDTQILQPRLKKTLLERQAASDPNFGTGIMGMANGGRIGFRGGGMDMGAGSSKSSKSSGPAGGASSGGNYGGNNSGVDRSKVSAQQERNHQAAVREAQAFNQKKEETINRIKEAQAKQSPIKTFFDHANFTKTLKRVGSIPNYHQLGGYDFMSRFPNTPPSIAKSLGYGYQGLTEGIRSLNPFDNYSFQDAMTRAGEEGRLNALGVDAYGNPTNPITQQYYNLPTTLGPNYNLPTTLGPNKEAQTSGGGGLANFIKNNIAPEYRLYTRTMVPGLKTGRLDEEYFPDDFKLDLRQQALDKYTRTGELSGMVNEADQHMSRGEINKLTKFPSTYATLGTYSYQIDPKTLNVKITDKYDWNPAYGTQGNFTGFVGNQPEKGGRDVDASMLKDYVVNSLKEGIDFPSGLELLGNLLGPRSSKGEGVDIDINIPTEFAAMRADTSYATGGRIGFKGGGRQDAESQYGADSVGSYDSSQNVSNRDQVYGGNNSKSDPDDNREQYGAQGQYQRPPSTPSDGGDNKINLINTLNKFRPNTFVNPYNFSVDLNKNIGPFGLNSFINTLGILGIDDPRTPEDESEQDDYGISASYIRDLFGGTLGLGAGYSPTTGTNFGLSFSKQFNQGGRVGFADGPNNLKKGKK